MANPGIEERGPGHGTSTSKRPSGGAEPTVLKGDGNRISTGTDHSMSRSPSKNGSMPNTYEIPRGYIHNEPNNSPAVRNVTGGRLRKGKV